VYLYLYRPIVVQYVVRSTWCGQHITYRYLHATQCGLPLSMDHGRERPATGSNNGFRPSLSARGKGEREEPIVRKVVCSNCARVSPIGCLVQVSRSPAQSRPGLLGLLGLLDSWHPGQVPWLAQTTRYKPTSTTPTSPALSRKACGKYMQMRCQQCRTQSES
jgi:hypothetical protein